MTPAQMAAMMKKMAATKPKKSDAKCGKPAKAQAQVQTPVKKQEPKIE
jgi:hypothetical protein